MKKIFIYYSLTGNGDVVANYLKSKGYDVRKVITQEPLPDNYILRILSGGYKAMINYEDKLLDFDTDISNYDEVVIGTPIWNDRLSSPINTVLKKLNLNDIKVSFILYSGSSKIIKAREILNSKYPEAKIISLKEPKNNTDEVYRIFEGER